MSAHTPVPVRVPAPFPSLQAKGTWPEALDAPLRKALEGILPAYVTLRRWYRGKSRLLLAVTLEEAVPLALGDERVALTISRFAYEDGGVDCYILPLACAAGDFAARLAADKPEFVVAALEGDGDRKVLYDALGNEGLLPALLELFARGGQHVQAAGSAVRFRPFAAFEAPKPKSVEPRLLSAEQTNTSVIFGDGFILKVFRQLDKGTSADLDMSAFLTEHGYANAPKVAGAMESSERGSNHRRSASSIASSRTGGTRGSTPSASSMISSRAPPGLDARRLRQGARPPSGARSPPTSRRCSAGTRRTSDDSASGSPRCT